eukprot:scaffold466_cov247-Chaetoceros_neogracile.AAC.11
MNRTALTQSTTIKTTEIDLCVSNECNKGRNVSEDNHFDNGNEFLEEAILTMSEQSQGFTLHSCLHLL